jgi:D-alanyl-D-alanine carboxypeptidase/D-alanyl-D-alanine carboxypeptidase (penicillin-binding protein 5/6)
MNKIIKAGIIGATGYAGCELVRLLINHNKMLKSYNGATGIKTGYTKKSGRCLVSAAEKDGVELIAVTLNAPDDWRDHGNMLDLGYSIYESKTLCSIGQFSYSIPVVCGKSDSITVSNTDEISAIVPKSYGEITYSVNIPRFIYAPVSRGEKIGEILFYYNGEIIAKSDMIALFDIEKIQFKKRLFNN